jgi:hypothetical protein
LTYYNTHQARIEYISNKIDIDHAILDIGCGEMQYYKKFMNKGFRKPYYAHDKESHFGDLGRIISERYNDDNFLFLSSLDEYPDTEQVNIILTEVIEHNSIEEARLLLEKIITYNFNKIIITTPNKDFNIYYGETLESRHDDHHFEMTQEEFKNFINDIILPNDHTITFDGIGDTINKFQPTQVAIITKK